MVVVGADAHKRSHTFVAVDAVGKQLRQLTVDATTKGHHKALAWVRGSFPGEVVWVRSETSKKIKIPKACAEIGVPYVNPFSLLRARKMKLKI